MMDNQQLLALSSLTYLDQNNHFAMVLENHVGGSVNLQPDQMLGRVEEVKYVCLQNQSQDNENTDEPLPTVNTMLVDTYCYR